MAISNNQRVIVYNYGDISLLYIIMVKHSSNSVVSNKYYDEKWRCNSSKQVWWNIVFPTITTGIYYIDKIRCASSHSHSRCIQAVRSRIPWLYQKKICGLRWNFPSGGSEKTRHKVFPIFSAESLLKYPLLMWNSKGIWYINMQPYTIIYHITH
jgi:hypothetical protein